MAAIGQRSFERLLGSFRSYGTLNDLVHGWRSGIASISPALARLFSSQILRDCRPKNIGVHQATLGIARLHNLALTGQLSPASAPRRSAARCSGA